MQQFTIKNTTPVGYKQLLMPIFVKFEEVNLKLKIVRKSSRCKKVRKSSRSTFNHNCYRKTLSTVNTVTSDILVIEIILVIVMISFCLIILVII